MARREESISKYVSPLNSQVSGFSLNMDAPQDANSTVPPPSADNIPPESYEFSYIHDDLPVHHTRPLISSRFSSLPPVITPPNVVLSYTPFQDAPEPDIPSEHGLQTTSGEAGVPYGDQSHQDYSSDEITDQVVVVNNGIFEQFGTKYTVDDTPQDSSSAYSMMLLHSSNFMPQLLPQNTFGNLQTTVDLQHEITHQSSNPEAATENGPKHLIHLAAMASNLNGNQRMLMGPHDMAITEREVSVVISNTSSNTINVNSRTRIMPGTISYVNGNIWPSTRQPSQSNLASSSLDLPTSQHSHQMSSMSAIPQRELHSQDSWTDDQFDYSKLTTAQIIGEGVGQNMSNRKRRKLEPEGCKNCKCKKSECLKLYCDCYSSSVYCTGSCLCQNCYNKPEYIDKVVKARKDSENRNPHAFAPKVTRSADSLIENGFDPNNSPASTGHIRGCNCKKSKCEKKYCECYENGVGCSIKCRCTECNNTFGRNSYYSELTPETTGTQRNESSDTLMAEQASQVNETLNNNDGHLDSTATTPTPSWAYRSNASGFNATQGLLNEDSFQRNPELLTTPNICQFCDGSSTTYIHSYFTYTNNPSPNSLRHPTPPYANPNPPSNLG